MPVHAVGKVRDLFAGVGIDAYHPGATNAARRSRPSTSCSTSSTRASSSPTWSRPTRSTATARTSRASTRALREIDAAVGGVAGAACATTTCSCSPPTTASTRARRTPTTRASTRRCWRTFAGQDGRRHDGPLADVGASGAASGSAGREAPRAAGPKLRAACPSCPRSRRSAASSRPSSRGGVVARLEIADPRWCLPLAPEAIVDAVAGPARRGAGAPRQVPGLGARGRRLPAHAPAHDRDAALRPAAGHAVRARALRSSTTATSCASATRGASAPASWRSGRAARDAFFAARLGLEPLDGELTGEALRRAGARAPRARSRRSCSTSGAIAGVGNIYADEALFRARIHPLRAGRQPHARAVRRAGARRCARRSRPASRPAARRSTTSATPTASGAPSRTSSSSTCARASRAGACGTRGASSSSPPGAGPTCASAASRARGAGALGGLRGELGQATALVGLHELLEAAEDSSPMTICGKLSIPVCCDELGASGRVLCEIDLLELELADLQQLPWRARRTSTARSSRR